MVTECGNKTNEGKKRVSFVLQPQYKCSTRVFTDAVANIYIASISNCVLPVDYATLMRVNEAIMCFTAVIYVVQRFYKYCCRYMSNCVLSLD